MIEGNFLFFFNPFQNKNWGLLLNPQAYLSRESIHITMGVNSESIAASLAVLKAGIIFNCE